METHYEKREHYVITEGVLDYYAGLYYEGGRLAVPCRTIYN